MEQLPNKHYLQEQEIDLCKSAEITNYVGFPDNHLIEVVNTNASVPINFNSKQSGNIKKAMVNHTRDCFVLSVSESDIENSIKRNSILHKLERLSQKWKLKMPAFKTKNVQKQESSPKPTFAITSPVLSENESTSSVSSIKLKENELEYSESIHSRSSEEDKAMLTIFEKLLKVLKWNGGKHTSVHRYHTLPRVDSNEIENHFVREKQLSYFERISAILHRNRLTRDNSTSTPVIKTPIHNPVDHAKAFN